MGNIFEDLYANVAAVAGTVSSLLTEKRARDKFRQGLAKYNKNAPEEYLTQIFTHIMLGDPSFRKAFLRFAGVGNAEDDFEFTAEYKFPGSKSEIDVYASSRNDVLIIENKLGDHIKSAQPQNYAKLYLENHPGDKRNRHFVVLAKFSDLADGSEWNGVGDLDLSGTLRNELAAVWGGNPFTCRYIYWYEVYGLLEKHFGNAGIKADLLDFLKKQNLSESWCSDIGSPEWRRELGVAYDKFAAANGLPLLSPASTARKLGPLGNRKICFVGSRVQGARSAELAAEKAHDPRLCCFLKLEIKNAREVQYVDLSECCREPVETIIGKCADDVLRAYGKKR